MENESGQLVELYIPRKCSATNRLIQANDHGSIQISVCDVDEDGHAIPGQNVATYNISGVVRMSGESDDCINRLATQDVYGMLSGKQDFVDNKFIVLGFIQMSPNYAVL